MITRSAYIKQINQLDSHVSVIGHAVIDDIRNTSLAIGEGKWEPAHVVIESHGAFERLHRSVEDSCMSLMLLQQPMASDLRLVTASFRAISDLARIDEMAYQTALLTEEVDLGKPQEVAELLVAMAEQAVIMVEDAVKAFGACDVEAAENVFVKDDTMDDLYEKTVGLVVQLLKTGEESASVAPEILSVAKYYERMGDHAQSVADWAIFRATGSYRGHAMGE